MKTIRSIIQLGETSKVITLPKQIAERVSVGKKYGFDINLLDIALEEKIVEYKCLACEHVFVLSENEDKYCPVCGSEDEDIIVETR